MNQFQLNGKEILAVRVEPHWTDFRVFHEKGHTRLMINKEKIVDDVKLPDFSFINLHVDNIVNYQIIGLTSEILKHEVRCKELVESSLMSSNIFRFVKNYKDYDTHEYTFISAIESFHSLLQRENMFLVNPFGEKFTPVGSDSVGDYHYQKRLKEQWQQAQDLVGERLLLEKIR